MLEGTAIMSGRALFVVDEDPSIVAFLAGHASTRRATSMAGARQVLGLRAPFGYAGFVVAQQLPDGLGTTLLSEIREHHPLAPAVLLVSEHAHLYPREASRLRAKVLRKPVGETELRLFLHETNSSTTAGQPRRRGVPSHVEVSEPVLAWVRRHGYALSPRETHVVDAVVRGCRRADIAAALGLEEATVKTIINGLMKKTGHDAVVRNFLLEIANEVLREALNDTGLPRHGRLPDEP
jgi:DNA-binding NarL/FixJ family response regulator